MVQISQFSWLMAIKGRLTPQPGHPTAMLPGSIPLLKAKPSRRVLQSKAVFRGKHWQPRLAATAPGFAEGLQN